MRISLNTTVVAPRVAFTGRKINYKKEYELAFGTYCECYDPKVVSKDAERDRTEPCIALFPAVNANGSWVFLNLKKIELGENGYNRFTYCTYECISNGRRW